jgi:hypothetical protein
VFVEDAAVVHVFDTQIRNNSAAGRRGLAGGGLFTLGTTYLRNATIAGNHAPSGQGVDAFNGGDLIYVLPAPIGSHVDGVFVCGEQLCPDPEDPFVLVPCSKQSCSNATWLQHRSLANLPQGPIDESIPTQCNPGFYGDSTEPASQSSALCSGVCPAGFVCPDRSTVHPQPVPIGFYSSKGATEPSGCAVGSYGIASLPPKNRTSQAAACALCPLSSTTVATGSNSSDDCVCELDFFRNLSRLDQTAFCISCPLGFDCRDGNIGTTTTSANVSSGFWRPSVTAIASRPCPHAATCLGGASAAYTLANETATCKAGFSGTYCTQCVDAAAYLDTSRLECRPCAQAVRFYGGGVLGGTAAVTLIVLVIVGRLAGKSPRALQPDSTARRCSIECVKSACATLLPLSAGAKAISSYGERLLDAPLIARIREASAATTLPVKLKICLGLYQLIAQFGDVYQIRYPADYQSASSTALAPLRGNLFSWVPGLHLQCFGVRTIESVLALYVAFPLGVALLAAAATYARHRTVLPALPFLLRWTYLLYPAVSSKGFQVLGRCDCFSKLDNTTDCFLPADYSHVCPTEYAEPGLRARAYLAVALYGIGVPLSYALLLHSARHAIRGDAETPLAKALFFLHKAFRADSLWWPLVEAWRVLLLTGVLALVQPGSLLQLFCAVIVAVSYNVLHIWTTPYKQPGNNFLAMGASTALIFNLLSSLGVQFNAKNEGGDAIDPRLLSIVLFAAGSSILGITLVVFLAALRKRRVPPASLAPSLHEPLVNEVRGSEAPVMR